MAVAFEDVRANGWVVVGGAVLDVRRFVPRHRGGRAIDLLRGTDATLPVINAHGIQGELPALPRGLVVGELDPGTLPPLERDLRALHESFRARGLYRYPARWLALDAARVVGLLGLGAAAATVSAALSFVLLTLALLDVMWWVHDVCHDSVFARRSRARAWAEAASILLVGTPVLTYQYVVHRLHHGFTNVLGADQALETGPVVWDERMRGRTRAWFVGLQTWAWFLVVLPLTFPLFLAIAAAGCVQAREPWRLALTAARWAAVIALAAWLGASPVLVVGPLLCAAYLLAFFSSLNHFHRPITETLDASFARAVTGATQNMTHEGRLYTWLSGGLNFHIEHHLFSTMPRRNYRVVAPEVRALCARHGLPYATCTFLEAVRALVRKLNAPYAAPPPDRRGAGVAVEPALSAT
jgi:fatty acid desaturase 3 (delta-6 desaturase)